MDKKAFGKQLQRYRERAGYSQETLAEEIGCSTIFISYIERGEKSPSLDTLVKLTNALNVSMDILFGRELTHYTTERLKYIEVIDSVVAIELKYHSEKRPCGKC